MKAKPLNTNISMSCDDLWDDLSAYVDNEISFSARQRVELHLLDCNDCRESVAFMREANVLLADLPDVTPPADLRNRILRATIDKQPWWQRLVPAAPMRFAVSGAAMAAAVIVVAAVMRPQDGPSMAFGNTSPRSMGLSPIPSANNFGPGSNNADQLDENDGWEFPSNTGASRLAATGSGVRTTLISTHTGVPAPIVRREVKLPIAKPRGNGLSGLARNSETPNHVEAPTFSEVPDPEMEKAMAKEAVKIAENKSETPTPVPGPSAPETNVAAVPRRIILTARLDPGDSGSGVTLADLRQSLRQRTDTGKIMTADFSAASHVQTLDVYRSRF